MTEQRKVVVGGEVLVGDPRHGHVRRADVLIEEGRIAAIGESLHQADADIVDAQGCWVLPGFVDTHRHLWQTTMRGLTAGWNLSEYFWCIRRNHSVVHGADDVYAGTYAGALEALECGVTCTVDHSHCINTPEHADEAVRAIRDSGIRALWCYGFYAPPVEEAAFSGPPERWADARRVRESHFPGDSGRVRMGVALNEIGLEPFDVTRAEVELARELGVRITAHTNSVWGIAQFDEVSLLEDAGLLGPEQLHSHCNTCTDANLESLGAAGSSVASTPDTELQMGLGFPIFARAMKLGVNAGLGIDITSNNSGDLFTAMRLGLQAERARVLQPVLEEDGLEAIFELPVSTRDVLHAATLGGARGLGLEDTCGSIEAGKAADLVLLRNDRLRLRPVIDPVDSIVLQASRADVDAVMVDGELVVSGGRLPAAVERRGMELIDAANDRLVAAIESRGGWKPPQPPALWEELTPLLEGNLAGLLR